jgi:hypothetical protein
MYSQLLTVGNIECQVTSDLTSGVVRATIPRPELPAQFLFH